MSNSFINMNKAGGLYPGQQTYRHRKFRVKILFIVACCSMLSLSAYNQNMESTIKAQAMEMARALINNDFNSFLKFVHPKIIEFAGGRDQFKNGMDSAAVKMQQFGASFKKILIGNPGKIIPYKGQLQCVVPQSSDIEMILGSVSAQTSLIAISTDNGKNWYFIDTNVYRLEKLKKFMPDLSPDLVIPPQQEPKFTPKNTNG